MLRYTFVYNWELLCDTNSHLCISGYQYYHGTAAVVEMQEKADR